MIGPNREVADGLAVSGRRIPDLARVDSVSVDLPVERPDELYVWAHRPTRDGDTAPLPVEVDTRERDPERDILIRPARSWLAP